MRATLPPSVTAATGSPGKPVRAPGRHEPTREQDVGPGPSPRPPVGVRQPDPVPPPADMPPPVHLTDRISLKPIGIRVVARHRPSRSGAGPKRSQDRGGAMPARRPSGIDPARFFRELLERDPLNPEALRWRTKPLAEFPNARTHTAWNARFAGRPAGSKHGKSVDMREIIEAFGDDDQNDERMPNDHDKNEAASSRRSFSTPAGRRD